MLGFMAVSGIAGWGNIRGLRLQLVLSEEIYSGSDTLIVARLTNTKRFMPSFLLQLSVEGTTVDFNFINGAATESESFIFRFSGRGLHPIEALVFSPFPVNFFVRCNRVKIEKTSCLVFPAPVQASLPSVTEDSRKNTEYLSLNKGMDGDVTRIRDYAGGDSMKMIHWRLSAKHPLLKVKELSCSGGEPVMIDPRVLPYPSLEARLSAAVYIVNRLMRNDRPVGLRTGDKIIEANSGKHHRLRLLTELALYDQN